MKHFILLLFISALLALTFTEKTLAVPAAPSIHQLHQNDNSSFNARKWGDENLSGWETEDGYTILFDNSIKSWTYAVHDADEKLISSGRQVGKHEPPGLLRKKIRPGKKALREMSPEKISPVFLPGDEQIASSTATPVEPQLSPPPVSNASIPVILVNFSDTATSYNTADFEALLFGSGSWSMADYFTEVSYGAFTVSSGPAGVIGWVTATQTHNYYGENIAQGRDKWPGDLVYEAVQAADFTVNFAQYDLNGDCYVDTINIVHQGMGEEAYPDATHIWSHSWSLNGALYYGNSHYGAYTTNDICTAHPTTNVRINNYVIQPEMFGSGISTMGVFAHEYGHAIGLPDLYDTDQSSEGIGNWSLMASGSWNYVSRGGDRPAHLDPWSKYALGWIAPDLISQSTSSKTFAAVESANNFFRLTSGSSEYFLLENRQKSGFDAGLPGSGLLLWHIDESKSGNTDEWYPGCVDCTSHYKVALVQADGFFSMEKNADRGNSGDPFPGSSNIRTISRASTPANNLYSGESSGFRIANISDSAATMTADIVVLETVITTTPADLTNSTVANFTFTSPETDVTFECLLDADSWSLCSSPVNFTGLADGSHTFTVRSKDPEGAVDVTPASYTWSIDTAPPKTSINSGPNSLTADSDAIFTFSSADSNATFTCTIDNGEWTACTSPIIYNGFAQGEHTFSVIARDLAGNDDPTPASWSWTITPPYIKMITTGQPESTFYDIMTAINSFITTTSPRLFLQTRNFTEAITINRCGEQMSLEGGYNPDFTSVIGQTSFTGVTITCGAVTIDNLVVM